MIILHLAFRFSGFIQKMIVLTVFTLGPLTYKVNGKTTLVGVLSKDFGCWDRKLPGVYARVTEALDFIYEEMLQTC